MTGPEHYREAEKLLRDQYRDADSIAAAQVHATLAVTDRLGELLAAWQHDVDSEPITPEFEEQVRQAVGDWLTRPNCEACGGSGKRETQCWQKGPHGFICTLFKGHDGDHIAHGSQGEQCTTWADEQTREPRPGDRVRFPAESEAPGTVTAEPAPPGRVWVKWDDGLVSNEDPAELVIVEAGK